MGLDVCKSNCTRQMRRVSAVILPKQVVQGLGRGPSLEGQRGLSYRDKQEVTPWAA